MSQSYCNLLYHMVFSTKRRRPVIEPELERRLLPYLGGALRNEGGTALEVNATPDHVHILAALSQNKAVADVLRAIKANSSGWIHNTFPESSDFAWQAGYGAFSVSESQVEKVRGYIRRQKEHHRHRSFKEEFVALLDAHGIEYDERYLWD